ncbi:MAG: glycosyltransferase, partial [Muribaculaceae bacterium]|nr:glycosyltransferase [Muribaculaceae bacterium]
MTPTFSIITVTWNAAKVIPPTLKSVKAQSCTDYEYLVVDGASTDQTLQLVNEAGIAGTRIVSERDNGLYDAMNKAIRLAKGKYLIWMNAGDAFADADSLARLADAAKSNPGVIYGQTQVVNAERQVVGMRHLTAPAQLSADDFKHGMLVCHQAFVARRD